jgi:NADPH-dependent 2,4-dienoyl-CoA reductase/sulfur reductase-like enzyme
MAAALTAWNTGAKAVTVIDRDSLSGGILNQCIHNGFGLHYFGEELTGPEYAGRFERLLRGTRIALRLEAMVLEIDAAGTGNDIIIGTVSPAGGYENIKAKSVVLAMGCRERTRGALAIPGTRPAGIFTAGSAQRYINMEGRMVGRRAVILGSGDIGLIMARRLTLEGARVLACIEKLPYPGGLTRNIVQCLEDFNIPLLISHTITNIEGKRRVERITSAAVNERGLPISGSEKIFNCDTLLLSVGLIPENELSRKAGITVNPVTGGTEVYGNMETSIPGVFACGNVVHVHDLVDYVSAEGEKAGKAAAAYAAGKREVGKAVCVKPGNGVRYTVPQRIRAGEESAFFFRTARVFGKSRITVALAVPEGTQEIASFSRSFMAPGEMERAVLDPAVFNHAFAADGAEIVISAEET